MNLIKIRIRYRRIRVTVGINKTHVCEACKTEGRTEFHHYKYAYKTSEVRKNPQLAADYTIELCYQCHKIADMIRKIRKDWPRYYDVSDALRKKKEGNHVTNEPRRCREVPCGAS